MFGVYRIEVKANKGIRVYVGSSENVGGRKNNHFSELKRGCHKNSRVQRCYNKYGKQNCQFVIQESVLDNDKIYLAQREQYWKDFWVDEVGKENVLNLREIYPVEKMSEEATNKIKGVNNSQSKLNNKLVREIREMYQTENFTQEEIAKKYNVHRGTILKIILNLTWQDKNYQYQKRDCYGIGENSRSAKLTWEQVKEIRNLYKFESYSQRKLAKMFNTCQSNVGYILRNETFKEK